MADRKWTWRVSNAAAPEAIDPKPARPRRKIKSKTTWGGVRPGAGAKPKKKKSVASPSPSKARAQKNAPADTNLPAATYNPQAIAAVIELLAERRRLKQEKRPNPFVPVDQLMPHPPKKGSALRLAMDSSIDWASQQWTNGYFNGMIGEGLAFLGYPYLSELAQRPEYRTFAETIADEMTRKWIEFKSIGVDEKGAAGEEEDGPEEDFEDEDAPENAQPGAHDKAMLPAPGKKTAAAKPDDDEVTPKDDKAKAKADQKAEKIKQLVEFLDDLKVRDAFRQFSINDSFFGRSHLFLDIGDVKDKDFDQASASTELKVPIGNGRDDVTRGKIKKGYGLRRIEAIEPIWIYPTTYNAQLPIAPDFYKPQVWYVNGIEVHRTRLLTGVARPVPDLLKPAYAFGGLSLSQLVKPYVDIWLTTRESIGELIHAFSVMVLMTDLDTMLQPGAQEILLSRLALFDDLRDNMGVFALNKAKEDFKNVATPLSGLPELQQAAQEHMMSIARIPAVKFTGMQPMGLNASSEGELQAFYDTIKAAQNWYFRPPLTTVIDLAQITLWGEIDPDITWDFVPLWEPTAKEDAEIKKISAETDNLRVDGGVLSPEEVRKKVASDPDSGYDDIDPDDVPEPPQDPSMGGDNPFGGEGEGEGKDDFDVGKNGASDRLFAEDASPWSESDHPRGKAGQFGSGGGGAAPKPAGKAKGSPKQEGAGELKPEKLKRVGEQMGSNPGGVFEDPAGRKFYIKKGRSPEHVQNELAAASLYQLAGAPTLNYRPVSGGRHVATEMEKLEKKRVQDFSPEERAKAQEDFATHAWLGNWDAVGLEGDNQGTVKGVPTSLDLGGALEYRAQGAPKGGAFGTKVGELASLRDPKVNPIAADVYGDMDEDKLRASAQKVTSIADEKIIDAVTGAGLPSSLAAKLIARKHDIARQVQGAAKDGVIPFDGALDEAGFEEGKHPRDPDGKFASGGGGGGGGEPPAKPGAPKQAPYGGLYITSGASAKENHALTVSKVINEDAKMGIHYRRLVAQLLKETKGFGTSDATAAILTKRLGEAWGMAYQKALKTGNTAEASKIAEKLKEIGVTQTVLPVSKEFAESEKSYNEAMSVLKEATAKLDEPATLQESAAVKKKAGFLQGLKDAIVGSKAEASPPKAPQATPEELKKASKATTFPESQSNSVAANALIKKFNEKYANTTLTDPAALNQKVADFKQLQSQIAANNAQAVAEQKEKAKAAAAAQKAKEAAEAKKHAEANAGVMKDLGITEQEAEGFNALVQMVGGSTADVIKQFHGYEQEAKGLGYPISGFQAALVKNYSDGGYGAINGSLRTGSWTVAQHVYVKMVNKALAKMPAHTGTVNRGATLDSKTQALYKVGHVIEERAFTSTSTGGGSSGNTRFKITAIGKRGASIQKLSHYPNEQEVLFQARTFFKVTKVETAGGHMTVHMTEMSDEDR